MEILTERLIKTIREAEEMMHRDVKPERGQIPLGRVDGVDYQLVVTRKESDFMSNPNDDDPIMSEERFNTLNEESSQFGMGA